MTTHSIVPPPVGNQLGQPQTANLSTKADAWRKAFEKEQAGVLQSAKSVKLGAPPSMPSAGAPDTQQGASHSNNAGQNGAENTPKFSPPAMNTSRQASHSMNSALFIPAGRAEVTPSQALLLLQAAQHNLQSRPSALSAGRQDMAATVAFLESHYKQKWPLKNIHVVHSDEGVRVWIRDASLETGNKDSSSLALRIQQAIEADGRALVGLVLNGKTIIG